MVLKLLTCASSAPTCPPKTSGATDAYVGENIQIVCEAPVGSCKQVIYPVGIVKASENADAAAEFLAYLQTDHTMQKFEGYGFSAAE